MAVVNMLEAKTNLSKLVDAVESGNENEVIIARNGKPAAKLVAISTETEPRQPLGFMDGKFPPMSLEDLNASNEEIERAFYGDDD
ncbi:type II toxin-antitoxin system prevent-host-death family antitoxin [Rhizobium sp. TH2]|nr:type II toxin-antitoxin system prevent-host-death family antitoxin [Rhizobium sp. TH2]UVC07177.1 type II toxin-antitoxin system prevent-host-death family antitoxin [Rhizobium sp. TH2]